MSNYQLIPFPLPQYLATYFANQIKSPIINSGTAQIIPVDRSTHLGKTILQKLEPAATPAIKQQKADYYLAVSNYAGSKDNTIKLGTLYFLNLSPQSSTKIVELIRADFDEALITFVQGAEFAHKQNGWSPDQKRRGIRKAAIIQFLQKNNVSYRDKNVESFIKMVQRAKKAAQSNNTKSLRKLLVHLSL